jgi:hypothetical protein
VVSSKGGAWHSMMAFTPYGFGRRSHKQQFSQYQFGMPHNPLKGTCTEDPMPAPCRTESGLGTAAPVPIAVLVLHHLSEQNFISQNTAKLSRTNTCEHTHTHTHTLVRDSLTVWLRVMHYAVLCSSVHAQGAKQ